MSEIDPVVQISRPTFAELSSRLRQAGHDDMLSDDGTIVIGNVVVQACEHISRARTAFQIEEAAARELPADVIFDDGKTRVISRCRIDGTHLIVRNEHNATAATVIIPREALMATASDLVECLSRDASDERVDHVASL